jgi:DnaJ homologue, subfamily C, member 28, conserved domain
VDLSQPRSRPRWLSDSYFAKIAGSKNLVLVRANLMSFHRHADEKIKEAIARGEFDNLPGKGKPLDLDAYFAMPEDLRMGYSILKSADIIPEEMELLKQIESLKNSLDSCTSPIEKRAIQQQLSAKITHFNMRMERYRKKRS